MEDYKSNSDKARQEQQSEKKVEAVITRAAKTRKKGEMQKFADVFIAEDANNVKSYILMEVIVPAVKKAISDIVTTGIDMILYGEAGRSKKNGTASKVSYRNYYERDADRVRAGSVGNRRNTPDYDDILFDTRGDAEAVLDAMNDIISQYGTVSVSDFYDLARVPNDNFTMNRYGWTNIGGATAVRVRDGYILKLPRANFTAIAGFWSVYKGIEFTANDVAMMMALLKIARIRTGTATDDSYVDLAGYAACGAEINSKN